MQRMSKFVRKGKKNPLLAGGSLVRKVEALERETQVHQKVEVTNREKKPKTSVLKHIQQDTFNRRRYPSP